MSFIAVDLGTSFIKGAVLDLDARRIDHIRRIPFPEPSRDYPLLSIKATASQMAVEAIKHGAYAIGYAALGDPRASMHAVAAAKFAAGAAIAGGVAKALHSGGGGTPAASTGGGDSAGASSGSLDQRGGG